ncbi:MAG: hypothetical protein QOK19_2485 [Solirubrobacteraceae bacterium]|jgi:predicted acylesterase/phospholipase RssA|nr:hypothetical protein [Solirubrobacteraceae bacterium]
MSAKTILSIDGGGIRGVIPATLLEAIEERTEQPVSSLFDVIAGTSTGGILALGLSCPKRDAAQPRFTAAELLDLYRGKGGKIFPHEFSGRFRQLLGPKYSDRGRHEVLSEKFDGARLSQALTDVLVTSYDLQGRRPFFFRSASTGSTGGPRDYTMVEAAMATSAAPTYFRPTRIAAAAEDEDELVLVDGGVFANNPAMCAFVDDSSAKGVAAGALIVSLGTGESIRRTQRVYPAAKRWGLLCWGKRIINLVFDGVSEATSYEIGSVLAQSDSYRFQVELPPEHEHLDDTHAANTEALEKLAKRLIDAQPAKLDELCVKLLQRAGKPLPPRYAAQSGVGSAA